MKKLLLYIVLFSFFGSFHCWGQDDVKVGVSVIIKKADRLYDDYKFQQALNQYLKASRIDGEDDILKLKIAETYMQLHEYFKAEMWYERGIGSGKGIPSKYILHYAQVLRNNEKYAESKKWFDLFDDRVGGDMDAKAQLFFMDNLKYYHKDSLKYVVEIMPFNTISAEFAPAYSNGKLYFLSNRYKKNASLEDADVYTDRYVVNIQNDSSEVNPVYPGRKLKFQEGPCAFYDNGNKVIVTRSPQSTKKSGADRNKLKLYKAIQTKDGSIEQFKQLEIVKNGVSIGHPAVSSDGKNLFFIMDTEGGVGKADLYSSEFIEGKWTDPKNMGMYINTPGDEMFPYLLNDSVLYFTSNGHPGLGGLDVFKVDLFEGGNPVPVNLGVPINSAKDDFGMIFINDNEGFFSSNRKGGVGSDDIYSFSQEKTRHVVLEGFTKDRVAEPLNMGHVLMYDDVTKERIGKSDENGFFRMELEEGREYLMVPRATAKPTTFTIHFEGFIRENKDTSNILDVLIINHYTKEQVSKKTEDGFIKFDLHEGVDYEIRVIVADGSNVDPTDIRFEGFVTNDSYPHINLGEVRIMDAFEDLVMFRSDKNGFFNFSMEGNRLYLVNAQRRGVDEFYELVFEGFIKNRKDTSQIVEFEIIDPVSGKKIYKKNTREYTKFIIEKDKEYTFQARLKDSSIVDVSQIRFEGFVKGLDMPIIISEARIMDRDNKKELFKSNKYGFFNFDMINKREYSIAVRKKTNPYKIWYEGFMLNNVDSISPAEINIVNVETGRNTFSSDGKYFGFELEEGVRYKIKAQINDSSKYDLAENLTFEGFASLRGQKINAGKRTVVILPSGDKMLESGSNGYFKFLPPKDQAVTIKLLDDSYRKKGNTKVLFSGFVKSDMNSNTNVNILVIDKENGIELLNEDFNGYFEFELQEGKEYKFSVKPLPVMKNVVQQVGLIAVQNGEFLDQIIIEETASGKLFEMTWDDGNVYYDDGIIKRSFEKKISYNFVNVEDIANYLSEQGVVVEDTLLIRGVYFPANSTSLLEKNKENIFPLVELMKKHQLLKLAFCSHDDGVGDTRYNEKLVIERNNIIEKYMRVNDVPPFRITRVTDKQMLELKKEKCEDCEEAIKRRTDFYLLAF